MNDSPRKDGYQFGALKGVFTPTILTIFGVIMYLRSGWMLGHVGLGLSVLIVTLSCAITFITSLSVSALATNARVGGGGAYFMISRSLGAEAGTAIGVPLYLAQALGITFYVVGFAEAFCAVVPDVPQPWVAATAIVILALLSFTSADLALRVQFVILAIVAASLVSFFAGSPPDPAVLPQAATHTPREPFWIVFAVFFPAVTGILSGVSMSGDLRDPGKAIPRGTLGAVILSFVVYLAIPIFLDRVVDDPNVLLANTMIMRDVARWGWLILAGVWAAALSSALGSFLAAPRTLQALARDGVLPAWIGATGGPGKDPRRATLLTFAVALAALQLGALNALAAILTMFFLTTYGVINLCAGLEELLGAPSWRPTFRVRAAIPLTGAAGCLAAMLMIDVSAAMVAAIIVAGIYLLVKRLGLQRQWGDIRYGLLILMVRTALYRLASKKADPRRWQPNILLLCGAPTARRYLIELAHALAGDSNCLTVATVVPASSWAPERVHAMGESISGYLRAQGMAALVKVLAEDDLRTGAEALIRAYGFGPVTPNTIMLGETEKPEKYLMFAGLIRLIHQSRRNLVMVREGATEIDPENNARIDIWWTRSGENIGLLMLLGALLKRSREWRDATLTVKTVVTEPDDVTVAREGLEHFVKTQRIEILTEVVVAADGGGVFDVIRESSRNAGLVFLGMRAPGDRESDAEFVRYYEQLIAHSRGLPPTAFVLAAAAIDFRSLYRS